MSMCHLSDEEQKNIIKTYTPKHKYFEVWHWLPPDKSYIFPHALDLNEWAEVNIVIEQDYIKIGGPREWSKNDDGEDTIQGPGGYQECHTGDYIVKVYPGQCFVWPKERFEACFEQTEKSDAPS